MPVNVIADKDAVLFMWAVNSKLQDAFRVIRAWGFEYKTLAFVWVKRNAGGEGWFWGMGSWTRANSELCLLATRGNPKSVSNSVHSVVDSVIGQHSAKPNEVRKRIVDLMGDLPRLEMFARGDKVKDLFDYNRFDGWDVYGNEVEDSIDLKARAQKIIKESGLQQTTAQGCHLKSETDNR